MDDYRAAQLFTGSRSLIAVLHVENVDHAEPLLEALVRGGITLLEVTLRSAAALEVIRRMNAMATDAIVGAGTVTRAAQLAQVADAGAAFAVSPALTPSMAEAAIDCGLPFLPGVSTPSEALFARECGFLEQKFFPADLMGGLAWIRHVHPLFPDLRFCPTGGISDGNSSEFLAEPNIFAVGGAYLAPRPLIDRGDFAAIEAQARKSAAIHDAR